MKLRFVSRLFITLFLFSHLLLVKTGTAAPPPQVKSTAELAQELLQTLTPEERVGQLFMVDFRGTEINEDSPILRLITEYHIGGVVLKATNENIAHDENMLQSLWQLIQDLQQAEITNSLQQQGISENTDVFNPTIIPLFVAISQNGDGYPNDQIFEGLTPIPSQMAIGATWNPDLAQSTGEILGSELKILGINMLLGPSLNVHANPRPELGGDLETTSFGGSSYWVTKMGTAYISGVHQGSDNRVAVITPNFPGFTGGDRPLNEEIPSVRKSLDQLLLTELPPFFAVTNLAANPDSIADGLLLTHARYQAFQSNISTITPPVTLDGQAIDQLLSLQSLTTWHQNGGLVVSSELGSQAIRRYYTQIGEKFDPRLLARDALLAGNDLMLTGNFLAPDDPDALTSLISTLNFFAQKYRDDLAFAQQVDEAVFRILELKFDLYDRSFSQSNILGGASQVQNLGKSEESTFEIARQSVTLIDPAPENLNNVLPNPPASTDFITIFTDVTEYQACEECPIEQFPTFNALEQEAIRLYGPSGDGLIAPGNIASYTFSDLNQALDQLNDPDNLVVANINRSEWVVFLTRDVDPVRPESLALTRFLSETPDLVQNRNIVVFAMNGPYYLNATDISTVTAYYSLYSKQPQFIEIAARILFQELNAPGASPVSINGVGYVLEQILIPDHEQTIPLNIYPSTQAPTTLEPTSTQTATPLSFTQGDNVIFETGIILDYNGNPVPDNTLVRFSMVSTNLEGNSTPREQNSLTFNGVARINYLLDTAGTLQVQVRSGDPAASSSQVLIDVAANGGVSESTQQIDTPEPTTPVEETPQVEITPEPPPRELNTLVDWLLSLVVIVFLSLFAYQGGALAGQVRWGVRWGLTALMGGLFANAYISFNLPGAASLIREYHIWGIVLSVAGGCLIGWGAGLLWRLLSRRTK